MANFELLSLPEGQNVLGRPSKNSCISPGPFCMFEVLGHGRANLHDFSFVNSFQKSNKIIRALCSLICSNLKSRIPAVACLIRTDNQSALEKKVKKNGDIMFTLYSFCGGN